MTSQWFEDVRQAFSGDAKLMLKIIHTGNELQGDLPALFGQMARYILDTPAPGGPVTNTIKKRKLEEMNTATNGTVHPSGSKDATASFTCANVSFLMPARKKLKIVSVYESSNAKRRELRLSSAQTGDVEHVLSNSQVEYAFCLPVPEKQQRQWNFCLLPQAGATSEDGKPCEQIVFTMNETKPDDASSANGVAFPDGSTYVSAMGAEMNQFLHPCGKQVITPSEAEFVSSIPQPHRKGEKGYHVKAHRGTKEGYLFFLSTGVIFGFKKPLSFFPFSAIKSISYTSVLQRTFNLVITATEGTSTEPKEIEFSMLDQADFAGIDEYIKRHELNDASMAEARKAKAYNVNKDAKNAETNGNMADTDVTQEKTEQDLQDEEDELEEDYEASGGESDGEGDESGSDGEEYDNADDVEGEEEEEDDADGD